MGTRNISHAPITFKHSNRAESEWCTSTCNNYPGTISELVGLARFSMCSLYMHDNVWLTDFNQFVKIEKSCETKETD